MAIVVIDRAITKHKHKGKHEDSHNRQMPKHKCKYPRNRRERFRQRTLLVMRHRASGGIREVGVEVKEVEEEDPVRVAVVDNGDKDEKARRDLHLDELELVDGCLRGG